jgi:hypothetical protein
MPVCDQCGQADISRSCSYCGDNFCVEHQLPENHDCSGLKNRRVSAEIESAASHGAVLGRVEEDDEQDDVDLSRPEPEVETSPETNLDGSIDAETRPRRAEPAPEDEGPSAFQRVKLTLEIQWLRSTALVRTLIRFVGVLIVLVGVHNFFALGLLWGADHVLASYLDMLGWYLGSILVMAFGASITWFL